jgi:hypothetical protein
MCEIFATRYFCVGLDLPEDAFDFGSEVPLVSRDFLG